MFYYMTRMRICAAVAAIAAALTAGCAAIGDPYGAADDIAAGHRFTKEYIKTQLCELTSFCRFTKPGSDLTVYIEGDGFAWRSRHELSADPTPRRQVVFSLAALDPSENVAYLARPGQFGSQESPACDCAYWSGKRFSPEVVRAMDLAIGRLKSESRSDKIFLVGFSGGAAIAVMIAAERKDIAGIRTICGNLDHEAVAAYNKVTPLAGSLNAMDCAGKISHIPQRHFASGRDKVIPLSAIKRFAAATGDSAGESVTVVEGTTHSSGWEEKWPSLITLPLYKSRSNG